MGQQVFSMDDDADFYVLGSRYSVQANELLLPQKIARVKIKTND
jgi:hypothetical protein